MQPSVRFWGVRGSYPSPLPANARYGGNTSCVEVALGGERFVFDAGTGLRMLGQRLVDEEPDRPIHLLISHTHWDHVQGLPFFKPLYTKGSRVNLYTLSRHRVNLREVFAGLWSEPLFPVPFSELAADLRIQDVDAPGAFSIGQVKVRTARLNHPYLAVGYRLDCGGHSVAYITDTAPFSQILLDEGAVIDKPDLSQPLPEATREALAAMERRVLELAQGVDLLIYDTQFTDEEYQQRPHWGHSTPGIGLSIAQRAKAGALALFHHSPERSDEALDAQVAELKERAGKDGPEILCAAEGMEVGLP